VHRLRQRADSRSSLLRLFSSRVISYHHLVLPRARFLARILARSRVRASTLENRKRREQSRGSGETEKERRRNRSKTHRFSRRLTFPDFSSADRGDTSDFSGGSRRDAAPATRSSATSSSTSSVQSSPQHHNSRGTVATRSFSVSPRDCSFSLSDRFTSPDSRHESPSTRDLHVQHREKRD